MFINFKQLTSKNIKASDGELGRVKDVYFDDRYWTTRFLVVDTHAWLPLSQKVLLSPIALFKFHVDDAEIKVSMTKEMVENCPKVEEQETVSREFEKKYFDYFGYGYYWTGESAWGDYSYPSALSNRDMLSHAVIQKTEIEKTNHLRSANEVQNYDVEEIDGSKGHVHDFIWDTYDWSLKYIVIDTRNWLPGGKKVLITPKQVDGISWESKTVKCKLSIQEIDVCREYEPNKLNDTEYRAKVTQDAKRIKS
jgi:hypothetical protein